jgi:tRNA threonylcarbamoyl adenosine modification protein (Sua5/YciO/YrdC/YwlC family)
VRSIEQFGVSQDEIKHAAELLRSGKLVAFPTETVYGLGANALDAEAVARVFGVKGRPSTSPIIVHVNHRAMIELVASSWPEAARILADRFWPGPLTLVVPKTAEVADIVTAGLPTVGVRMPAHPVALALIEAAQVPVAAPAQTDSPGFRPPSPTTFGDLSEIGWTTSSMAVRARWASNQPFCRWSTKSPSCFVRAAFHDSRSKSS